MKLKYIKIAILYILLFMCFSFINNGVQASGIDPKFPEIYKKGLSQLQTKHPNWSFIAKNVGISLDDAVNNEYGDKSQVNNGNGWLNATKDEIKYAMNPLNYLNEKQIFQFENLSYRQYQIQEGVDSILYSTYMSTNENGKISTIHVKWYNEKDGKYYDCDKTYSQAIFDAGKMYSISPYHLAARILEETGCDIYGNDYIESFKSGNNLRGSLVISGNYNNLYRSLKNYFSNPNLYSEPTEDYTGFYNFYNIGGSLYKNLPVIRGMLKFAKTPAGPNEDSYGEPWDNPIKAIEGGAKYLSKNYIDNNQNTLYFQKFNVIDKYGNNYSHQYQQNIYAPRDEASFISKAYNEDILNNDMEFIIPVYNDVPGSTLKPGFVADDTIMKVDAGNCTNVNVRADVRN